jgi:2-amino-4-hydroxy-6-hydroxymethyldihydropteridine diphosphokinase
VAELVYVGVGANLGDRNHFIDDARKFLTQHSGIRFKRSAQVYETEPVGGPSQGKYLNTVWEIETDLSAREFLAALQTIESQLGRKRLKKNEARIIDLDILFFGGEVIEESHLIVPHPHVHERWFTLKPLSDLCPDLIHPVLGRTVSQMLNEVETKIISSPFMGEEKDGGKNNKHPHSGIAFGDASPPPSRRMKV